MKVFKPCITLSSNMKQELERLAYLLYFTVYVYLLCKTLPGRLYVSYKVKFNLMSILAFF